MDSTREIGRLDAACPICGSKEARRLGPLPAAMHFAGAVLDRELAGGHLWDCTSCGFSFRAPSLTQEAYFELYAAAPDEVWQETDDRNDFVLVRAWIEASLPANSRILDVGCNTGDLLAPFASRHEICGIEPSTAAAQRAEARGLRILGGSLDALPEDDVGFDLIIACDVLEHVVAPLDFLRAARGALAPTGRLLITTGDRGAPLWRLCGSSFWYCSFPEHVSFMSCAGVSGVMSRAGLDVETVDTFNYRKYAAAGRAARYLAALGHALAPRTYAALRARMVGGEQVSVPGCGASADHLFVVARAGATRSG